MTPFGHDLRVLAMALANFFPSLPVPVEKGNAGSGNENGTLTSTLHALESTFFNRLASQR